MALVERCCFLEEPAAEATGTGRSTGRTGEGGVDDLATESQGTVTPRLAAMASRHMV